MTFAILGRTALLASRRTSVATTSQQARRRMGSSAPAQEWTGIDKVVRSYFPKDEQLAAAIMGGYFGIFVLVKIKGAMSGAPAVEVAPVVVPSGAGAIPDVDSEGFGAFLDSEENVTMLVESFEK
ncbi:hypothetical protein ACHAW5_007780 [Stephanodiscus triporus]|uniref:Uncharacterized protein n=1 Tax=Stephanodiscus triporus TaxID=2934178 RepID=A0ABD3MLV4_9STRA